MKKTLLFVLALLMSASFSFAANPANPDLLAQGFDAGKDGATYDAATKTITFPAAWTGMRWEFWGVEDQVGEYETCTIEFEPVAFGIEFIIANWNIDGGAIETKWVAAGEGTATINVKPATEILIQSSEAGTLTMKAAYLSKGEAPATLDILSSFGSSGWGSSYDAATKTITYDSDWTGRGWWFGKTEDGEEGANFSSYDEVVVKFEPVEWEMRLIVEYNGEMATTTVPTSAGASTVSATFDAAGKSNVMQIYIQSSKAGQVKLLEAYLVKAGGEVVDPDCVIIFDFADLTREDNNNTQMGWKTAHTIMDNIAAAKYFVIETEGEGNNNDGFNGIQFIVQGGGDGVNLGWTQRALNGDWTSFPRAEGKTVSLAIDLENALGDKYNDFLQCTWWGQLFIGYYPNGMTAAEGLGYKTAYLTKDFAKPAGAVNFSGGTDWGFVFEGSIACDGEVGIIPVPLLPKSLVYNTANGIIVNAVGEKFSVYGIDGRLVKQAVANNGFVSLPQGLYIVKVGDAKAVKVVVR